MQRRFIILSLFALLVFAPYHVATAAAPAPLTLQEAIAKVQRETGGKVLSAETRHTVKQTVYRIKVLTREGQVKVVEVQAES
jgi:uncharacterized membrane protein YkoI